MGFSSPTKDALVDFIAGKAVSVSLHTGNCGDSGANEAVGVPHQPVAFPPSAKAETTAPDVTFTGVPAGTYTHFGLWDSTGAFIEGYQLLPAVTLTATSDLKIKPFIKFADDYSTWGWSDTKGEWIRVGSTTEKGPSTAANELANLRNQISNVVTGLMHESPVDSICQKPPTKPREGTYYIVSKNPPPTGAFKGHEDSVAIWDPKTKWTFVVPQDGEARLVEAENQIYSWNGINWVKVGSVASKGDTDFHAFPAKASPAGGDEIPLVDVADGWAKKKMLVVDLEEATAKYISDKSMNLENKGFDLAKNQLHGTITDFNNALDDGYEFATKDDLADLVSRDDAQSYSDDGDNEVRADMIEAIGLSAESLTAVIDQKIEDAIDAIPDVDTTTLSNAIEAQRVTTEQKFDDLAAATQAKLDAIPTAAPPDLSAYITTDDAEAEITALQDYVFDLLARHASRGDYAVISSLRTELDNIFAAQTAAPGVKDTTRPKGGHTVKPPPPKPKPWVTHLEDKEYVHLGPGTWVDVPALPANPVKGSLFLNASLDVVGSHVILKAFVHDGTDWVDDKGKAFPNNAGRGDRPSIPTMQKYSNNPGDLGGAHSETQYFNPSALIVVACADGIHMCYCDEMQNPPVEYIAPYPAGVTLADMPASKTF